MTKLSHVTTVSPGQHLTSLNASSWKSECLMRLTSETQLLSVDLETCEFVDSSGIGSMMGVWKECMKRGVQMELRNVPAPFRKQLALIKLDQVLTVNEYLAEA